MTTFDNHCRVLCCCCCAYSSGDDIGCCRDMSVVRFGCPGSSLSLPESSTDTAEGRFVLAAVLSQKYLLIRHVPCNIVLVCVDVIHLNYRRYWPV